MHRLFVLMSALAALVPVLGLTSACSKKSDDWKMNEPTIVGSGIPVIAVSDAVGKTFPFDARLVFTGARFDRLHVDTKCESGALKFAETSDLNYQDEIAIKTLWPHEMWSRLSLEKLSSSQCDFAFEASTASGSTQTFKVRSTKLSSFYDTTNRSLFALNTAMSSDDLVKLVGSLLEDSTDYTIICGDLAAHAHTSNLNEDFINQLESRIQLRGVQICHFVASSTAENSAMSTFELSPDVQIRFGYAKLDAHTHYTKSLSYGKDPTWSIDIKNQSSNVAFIRIPTVAPNSVVHFDISASSAAVAPMYSVATTSAIVGGETIASDPQSTILKLEAGSQMTINLKPNVFDDSRVANAISTAQITIAWTHGFSYGFEKAFVIDQASSANFSDSIELTRVDESSDMPYVIHFVPPQ